MTAPPEPELQLLAPAPSLTAAVPAVQPTTAFAGLDDEVPLVLIIEDNPGDAHLIREALRGASEGEGFSVTHADRLATGLEQIAAGAPQAVLLDLGLPDAAGIEGLLRVRAAAPHLPIIVLTGRNDDALASRALQRGAQDYVVKGQMEDATLRRVVRHAIERKRAEVELERKAQQVLAQKAELESILNSLPHGLMLADVSRRVTLINTTARAMLGSDPFVVQRGRPEVDFWPPLSPDGRPVDRDGLPLAAALSGRTVAAHDHRIVVDGEERFLAISAAPLVNDAGAVHGAVADLRDVTSARRRQADARAHLLKTLAGAQEQARALLAALTAPPTSTTAPAYELLRQQAGALCETLDQASSVAAGCER